MHIGRINLQEVITTIPLPSKPSQIAVISSEKGSIIDIKLKRNVRSIPKWGGSCTRDGKYGLYAPSRGGLELLELRKGTTVKTFIPKVHFNTACNQFIWFTINNSLIIGGRGSVYRYLYVHRR